MYDTEAELVFQTNNGLFRDSRLGDDDDHRSGRSCILDLLCIRRSVEINNMFLHRSWISRSGPMQNLDWIPAIHSLLWRLQATKRALGPPILQTLSVVVDIQDGTEGSQVLFRRGVAEHQPGDGLHIQSHPVKRMYSAIGFGHMANEQLSSGDSRRLSIDLAVIMTVAPSATEQHHTQSPQKHAKY